MLTSMGCMVKKGGVMHCNVSFLQIYMSISNRNKLYNISIATIYSNNN